MHENKNRSEPALRKRKTSAGGRPDHDDEERQATVAGVTLTHPEKVLYPEQNLTKRDLADYYAEIADWILPHVTGRPLSLVRCPAGRQRHCFFQKHVGESMGPAIHGVTVREKQGEGQYVYIRDLAGLISLVQIGVLEIHPWGSRADRYERPDRMVFDLDPDPAVAFAETVAAAQRVREFLQALGLQSFVKTTGGKGLHVVVPLMRRNSWDEAREFSETVARAIVASEPARYVANMRKDKRRNRIFIDFLRNARGATSVAAYSTRAKAGAPVSTPLRWDELTSDLTPDRYNVGNVRERLAALKADPWKGFGEVRQSITKAMLRSLR